MSGKHIAFLLGSALGLAVLPSFAAVPVPQVTGPVAAPDVPGSPSHNYIFFSSNHELASRGYVEEEYFIRGKADGYTMADKLKDGAPMGKPADYYTRVVVRRPADAKHFNGAVVVEWDNVTNNFDAENVWFYDWDHMMRSGYVWVGVSNQTIGIDALRKWSAKRYGEFDVGKSLPVPGGPDADAESYDIFSQVGAALKHPQGVDMLGGLKPKVLLATGESQGAGRLANYVNSVQNSARIYDGFLLLSAVGSPIRPDVAVPVFKLNTEHDVLTGDAAVWQPDSAKFHSWDVAGTSHVDRHLRENREPMELRDNGLSLEAKMAPQCANPQVGTRTPMHYVVGSAFDKLTTWVETGKTPPAAPHLTLSKINQRPEQSVPVRNADSLAQGGIQLSAMAVPTQINYGLGAPADPAAAKAGGEAIGAGACVRWGYSVDMTVDQLNAHYSSHADYVAKVKQAVGQNLKDGYILPYDAAATIKAAEDSQVGRPVKSASAD